MRKIDVTQKVKAHVIDDEACILTKCVCGASFNYGVFTLGVFEDMADECPHCGRKLICSPSVKVYEVVEE